MSDITTPVDSAEPTGSDITPFIVRAPLEIVLGLDRAADRRGISRNAFVLKALKRVLDGEPPDVRS